MVVALEKGEVEVTGIWEEENEYVMEGEKKVIGMRTSGQLEEGEVTGRGDGPVRNDKQLQVERIEENPPNRQRDIMSAACTKSL
jgi:hypothetical protein